MVQRRTDLCLTEEQQQGEDIPDDLVDEENVALKNVARKDGHGFYHNEMENVGVPAPPLESYEDHTLVNAGELQQENVLLGQQKRHKFSRKTRHIDQRKSQAIEDEAQASQNGNPNFNTTPTNSSGVPVLLGSVNPQYGLQQVRITVKFRSCRGTFQQP
ncbi:hypothetical protein HYE68_010297 [Fusarium pseudograminearum]|nr:hypothetical protein HYE68_010297 [Fusarium pseudograminearum]